MSGSGGVSIARTAVRGENRFYNPPPLRRLQQEARLQQRKERKGHKEKHKGEEEEKTKNKGTQNVSDRVGSLEMKGRVGPEDCGSSECSESGSVTSAGSNLDRFLEHTTPVIHARYLPKLSTREHRTCESNCHPYFMLVDLWEAFAEWSVYGAGVPLVLNGSEVVQYYVPYLSGIQLYADPAKPGGRLRRPGGDSDAESLRKTSIIDGSGNYRAQNQQKITDMNIQSLNRLSLGDKSLAGSSSVEGEISNPPGQLIFEYLEHDPPFGREPLADKISVLASRFPELLTYRTCDLSQSSWISVAWYPIYRIPIGPTLQNLDACFLTFHSLSTHSQSTTTVGEFNHSKSSVKLPLPTFGLASYKFKVAVWNVNGVDECQKANSLLQAADNWLKRLHVNHPDYRFFMSHNPQMR